MIRRILQPCQLEIKTLKLFLHTFNSTLRGEGKFVKQVVMELLRMLNINCLHVAKSPVGLKARMEDVIKLLEINDNRRLFVGIWGMGGLGKTTLSKAVYNEIHHLFEASCFVSDIRDTSMESIKGLRNLQRQILKDLVKVEIKLNSIDQGKIQMKNHLASIKALVILDDIDNEEQLDALVGDWYGTGSRIIITTRDIQVLKTRKVDMIYPMKGLNQREGVELFSWHAFLRAIPEEGYEAMSERIVNACEGLPLSLEILGAHLYGKSDRRYWNEALQKIQSVGPVGSIEFHVKFWEVVGCKDVYTSIKNLEGKSLIVIDNHFRRFWMHDHLRDLGRRIVEEESCNKPSQRSRLWLKEDIVTVMDHREEMQNVRRLKWKGYLNPGVLHQIDSFSTMHNLKFLFCWGLHLKREIALLPPNLRYLVLSDCRLEEKELFSQISRTESGESSSFFNSEHSFRLPQSIGQLKFLRYLDMSDTKLRHLPEEVGELLSLEELYLNGCCLSGLPQSFGNLINLKVLDIGGSLLYTFPANFKKLRSLSQLTIEYCENLEELPSLPKGLVNLNAGHCCKLQNISKISRLTKLKILDLSFCRSFVQLPKLDSMHSLRKLKLDYCEKLLELPALPEGLTDLTARSCYKLQKLSSMVHMRDLKILVLSSCHSLTKLPNLEAMHSLRKLTLEHCDNLEELPSLPEDLHNLNCSHCCNLHKISIISDVRKLETLDLSFCERLTKLPKLDCLHSLKILNLQHCRNLGEVPFLPEGLNILNCSLCCNLQKVSITSDGRKLETLDLSFCASLNHLPNLDCLHFLQEFKIQHCKKLEELPTLPGGLINLDATHCYKLQKMPSLSHMRHLETLDLSFYISLSHLPQLDNLASLRNLILSFCSNLEELPALPEGLVNLNVGHCCKLQNMSSISQTRNLKTLELSIYGCLSQFPQLECLQSLKKLTLHDWYKLEELPALPGGLVDLNATHCQKLRKMPIISYMRYMETLDLSHCSSLTQLPELNFMYSLRKLKVEHCEKLKELPSLPAGLNNLNVAHCSKLQKMSSMSHMRHLEILYLSYCISLSQIPELDHLHSLRTLKLDYCDKLEELSALPKGLTILHITSCYKLQKLFSMSHMQCLGTLEISSCKSLTKIPQLSCIQSLRELTVDYCDNLQELLDLPESLINLKVRGCNNLSKLSSISHMRNLRTLDLSWCKSLTKLPKLVSMHSLRELILEHCEKLEELSSLPEGLNNLNVRSCYKLQNIPLVSEMCKLEITELSSCKSHTLPQCRGIQSSIECTGVYYEMVGESYTHLTSGCSHTTHLKRQRPT